MAKKRPGAVKDWSQIRMVRMLVRATEHFVDTFKHVVKEEGLTLGEFDVIAALGNTEGLRMSDIAQAMLLSSSPSNATRVCAALEKRGLITRQRSPESDREVIARLTPAGEAKFRESFMKVVLKHADFIDDGLTHAEQREVTRLLGKFVGEPLSSP